MSGPDGSRIERRSIDVVPDAERHGSPANQFTLWFGANMQITAMVDGALAVVFGADGRYGRWNAVALISYGVGVVVQIPFMAQSLYTGPISDLLGGTDTSWLVGLAVTAAVYFPLARRTTRVPAEMIYPADAVSAGTQ